jgi:hypothetical protein
MVVEALVGAAAEVVLGKALDVAWQRFNLDDKILARVKSDPAKVAFKIALAQAYSAFARNYAALRGALFTEPFLTGSAASELAKLVMAKDPDPLTFAQLWVSDPRHHVTDESLRTREGAPTALATEAATYFLDRLREALRHSEPFRPLFDSRALDHLPDIAASFAGLEQTLANALKTAEGYANMTRISVQVEGDYIVGTKIVTQSGDYAPPDSYYKPPDTVFSETNVQAFVGRAALKARIDAFSNRDARYGWFLIEGEAGLGKTALLAHLVYTRGYCHVFGTKFYGAGARSDAIAHLVAQLVERFQIEAYREAVSATLVGTQGFLDRVLRLASDRLSPGERLVIVYDALDEHGAPTNDGNPLGLPRTLPPGVFVIATQRPVQDPPMVDDPTAQHLEPLRASSDENQRDIRDYLKARVLDDRRIRTQIDGRYKPEQVVDTLAQRSEGNWMYLHYVMAELESGQLAPLDLDQLPRGLNSYYLRNWQKWQRGATNRELPDWQNLYLPVLAMLAAVQEPVGLGRLLEWANLEHRENDVIELLERDWRAFVNAQRGNRGEARYHFLHPSLTRFMRGDVEWDTMAAQEQRFVRQLAEATRKAHSSIVDLLAGQCNTQWSNLVTDDYARRHLVPHLAVIDPELMFDIVARSDTWAKARETHEDSYAGYLNDLALAWGWAKTRGSEGLGAQLRCALIKSSIHSLAGNYIPTLLRQAVEAKLWPPLKALALIKQISNESARAAAATEVFLFLPQDLQTEAIAVIRKVTNSTDKANAMRACNAPLSLESWLRGKMDDKDGTKW